MDSYGAKGSLGGQRKPDGTLPVVHFVTSNKQKLREVQALLADGQLDVPFKLEALDVTLPELQDDPTVVSPDCRWLRMRGPNDSWDSWDSGCCS